MRNPVYMLMLMLALGACNNEDTRTKVSQEEKKDTVARADSMAVMETLPPLDSSRLTTDTANAPARAITLQFNLRKGKRYQFTMEMRQEMGPNNFKNSMLTGYTLEVNDDDGKVKTLKAIYDKIVMHTSMGAQQIEVSSEAAPDPSNPVAQLSKVFAAVKGKSFTMKVRNDGEIVYVEGFDKIGEAMVAEMDVPQEERARMLQNFQKQFNNETVKQMFAQSFNIFPKKPVKVGDQWTREVKAINGQSVSTQYTLRKVQGNEATITASSKMQVRGMNAVGNQTTILQVDTRTGLVTKGQFEQKLEGQVKMKNTGLVNGREL